MTALERVSPDWCKEQEARKSMVQKEPKDVVRCPEKDRLGLRHGGGSSGSLGSVLNAGIWHQKTGICSRAWAARLSKTRREQPRGRAG